MVLGIDDQWQADLVDLSSLKKYNQPYRYLLTCIDIFSKFAWVVPMRDKTGHHMVQVFAKIFKERKPQNLQTDDGTEFKNRVFQAFLKKQGVYFFTTKNETKASVVERFNRTIKSRMWKYFTSRNSNKYVGVIPKLVRDRKSTRLNSSHRSLSRMPSSA